MNILEKINVAKKALYAKGLNKSGRNDFSKYDYFELADFLPDLVALENQLGFICIISFNENAELCIMDTDQPESQIIFSSPMSTAALKGMHEVQNLGAVQTYLRRYLYVTAFEIVEHDALDGKTATPPATGKTAEKPPETISKAQIMELTKECMTAAGKADVKAIERLKGVYTNHGYKEAKDILAKDFEQIKKEFIDGALPFNL